MGKLTVDNEGQRRYCQCRSLFTRTLCRFSPRKKCQIEKSWDSISSGGKSSLGNPAFRPEKAGNKFWD